MNCMDYVDTIANLIKNGEYTDSEKNRFSYQEVIENISKILIRHTDRGKKLIFIGNGGSAAICSHAAIDFWKNGNMRSLSFNDGALLTCISNDFGYESSFRKPVEMFADEGDILIAISSSGKSKNILNAVETAKIKECTVITLSGFEKSNPLKAMGDFNIYISISHYGFVELCHQIILHNILDYINE